MEQGRLRRAGLVLEPGRLGQSYYLSHHAGCGRAAEPCSGYPRAARQRWTRGRPMGAEIERFLSAIHAFAERVEGPDGEVRDITTMAHTLARIATGGIWFAEPQLAGEVLTHRQGAGDTTDGSEANLRDWLTHLVVERRML